MLKQGDIIDVFKKLIIIFGLTSQKESPKQVLRKTVGFLTAVPIYCVMLAFLTFKVKDTDEKLQLIQIIPSYVVITLKALNMMTKFDEIKLLMDDVKRLFGKIDSPKILSNIKRQTLCTIKFFLCLNFVPAVFIQIISLLMHDTFMPVWIPETFSGYENYIFYFYWFAYSFCGLYASSIALTVDLLVVCLLLSFKGFTEFLGENMAQLLHKEEKNQKLQLVKFLMLYDDFNR